MIVEKEIRKMNIKTMAEQAYKNAVRLGKIGDRGKFEKLEDLYGEYMEALKALNNNHFSDWDFFNDFPENVQKKLFEKNIKDTYEDELTDCLKVVLTLMVDCGMDIEKHWKMKSKYNELRDDHK